MRTPKKQTATMANRNQYSDAEFLERSPDLAESLPKLESDGTWRSPSTK